ncbi:hypothetical protein A2U01_0073772, partial [Trifolium medium]|nr:hypothetical protein [Trifolium medium]
NIANSYEQTMDLPRAQQIATGKSYSTNELEP